MKRKLFFITGITLLCIGVLPRVCQAQSNSPLRTMLGITSGIVATTSGAYYLHLSGKKNALCEKKADGVALLTREHDMAPEQRSLFLPYLNALEENLTKTSLQQSRTGSMFCISTVILSFILGNEYATH